MNKIKVSIILPAYQEQNYIEITLKLLKVFCKFEYEVLIVVDSINDKTSIIGQYTDLPIAVGFGISGPEQAKQVSECADAIVVGSAIVNQIAKHGSSNNLTEHVADYVKTLVDAVKH